MSDVMCTVDGPVATIALNRPASLNSFAKSMRLGVLEAVQRVTADANVRAVVITGEGRGFSAGADLREEWSGPEETRVWLDEEYRPGILAILESPKPFIAAVHGFAAGIAVGYALACDLIVMGEGAFFELPFSALGLVPDGGLTWQLARRLGHQRAFQIAVDRERLAAPRCLDLGLVNRLVAEDQVLTESRAWASRLAQQSPTALAGLKQCLRTGAVGTIETTMDAESKWQTQCVTTPQFSEGVRAFRARRT